MEMFMSYAQSNKKNLLMHLGLGLSLFGIGLYDPLGFLFTGMGLVFVSTGLACIFASYFYLEESEKINKAVHRFEKK
tara:strand:+ start:384 stop:614 length:231 start_codon:yes stop_codon:yes gene_type:complete